MNIRLAVDFKRPTGIVAPSQQLVDWNPNKGAMMNAHKEMPKSVELRPIRDKEFARRLESAVLGHPHAPDGHGRQKWVREKIEERFNVKLTPEAVRKWFAGEARPRPQVMSQLAQALEVDEAWLSLGITPAASPVEKRQQNATATGAVNLVAGMIQMSGGNIAFPQPTDEFVEDSDMYAIIKGKGYALMVKSGIEHDGRIHLAVPSDYKKAVVIAVVRHAPTNFSLIRLTSEVIAEYAKRKGGYYELNIDQDGKSFLIDDEPLPVIKSFDNLDGEIVKRRAKA